MYDFRVAERVLSGRELNRALLARQLLLERADLPVPKALERIGGLQTQDAKSCYIGLSSRLERFERDDLTTALERRRVVQATLMRITIHTVSAGDYPILTHGVRRLRRESWIKSHSKLVDVKELPAIAERVRSVLRDGPGWRRELVAELGLDSAQWNGVGMWVDLVRAPPSGTWERPRGDLYALAETWLGPSRATEQEGFELLLRRYLGGFGPASLRDAANWADLPPQALAPAAETLPLRRFRDQAGTELLDVPRAPLPAADTPAPPRLLANWDAMLLVHARRAQILPERYRSLVFNTKTPQSTSTFLVDGQVAGTWKLDHGRILLEPFEPLNRDARRALAAEAERMSELLA
jgi:Winged helix DNA-binding domain